MNELELPPNDAAGREAFDVLQRLASSGKSGRISPLARSMTVPNAEKQIRNLASLEPAPRPERGIEHWSEQTLRDLIELLPDAVVVIDGRGVIVLVNDQTDRIFGYQRQEMVGQRIEILIPERFRGGHVGHRDRYFEQPRSRPMGAKLELFGRRKDGSEFPVEISLSPLMTERGVFATSVIRDISQRKRDEAKFRTLVENIPAVTFIAPLDDSVPELYVSPQIEHLLGFSQKEWLEDPVLWYRQLHPDDQSRWNHQFAPTCASGEQFNSVYRFIAKDGHVVWVHGSASVVRDADGVPSFLQGVAFDITAIKEAEGERDRFFSLSIDLFCVAGIDGYFKRINPAFTRTLNFTSAELLAVPFLEFVHPDDRHATQAEVKKLASGGTAVNFENRFRCKDGTYKWLQWAATPHLDQQVIYAAARDVTEQKRDVEALRAAEEALRQSNAELERRVAERTEELARTMADVQAKAVQLEKFADASSHDLQAPLRTIINWLQMLAKKYQGRLDEEAEKWITFAMEGAQRQKQLIAKLLEYSKSVKPDRKLLPVDCGAFVQTVRESLLADIEECGAQVSVGELPIVLGHADDLSRLFQNLISNAIKYRDPDRLLRIEIGAEAESDRCRFWVRDNGSGIEARHLAKLFTLGIEGRVHKEYRKIPGHGYGLNICKTIVAGHGGTIWVESKYGEGTSFFFTLPIARR